MNRVQTHTGRGLLALLAVAVLGGCLESEKTSSADRSAAPPGDSINSAPVISGNPPPQVVVGSNYSYSPSAFDLDGDPLTFSVQNKPNWANFNSVSGTLTGSPFLGSVGVYPNIRITVSDGSLSTSTPAFNIAVVQAALGSATLSWSAPSENTDGSPLMNLSSYKIYYGTTQGRGYNTEIPVSNPGITTFVVENLAPDTYYFVTTALNSDGVESDYSNEAVKVVN